MTVAPRQRRSARVIAIDPDRRVLLFWCDDPHTDDAPFWLTPGGAVDAGEELRDAATRELFEETGRVTSPADLVGPVATCEGDWEWRGTPIHSIDTYFLLHTEAFDVDRSRHEPEEAEVMGDHKWWPVDEIDDIAVMVVPNGLAALARDALAGAAFDEPRVLPWDYPGR